MKNTIGNLKIEPSITAGIEQMQSELRTHINQFNQIGEISYRITKLLGRMLLYYVTFETVSKVIGDSIKVAAERERNICKLEAVLSAHNIKNKEITRIYADMAKEINNTTIYTTEAALAAEGVLTTLGVAPDLMREALNASSQLATQTGSLESAAQMLGLALAGNTRKIGNIVYALKGVKNASPQKVFKEINLAFGKSAQAQMDGYMGQCARLKKEYVAFSALVGKFIIPYLTKTLRYLNQNKQGVMSRDPAVAVPAMINEWLFGEKQWTWSIGRQTNPKVLETADNQFVWNKITNDDAAKREAERSQKTLDDYYNDVQKILLDLDLKKDKEADELAKKEREFQIEQSEFILRAMRESMTDSWAVKAKRLEVVNRLEEITISDQYKQMRESLDSIRSLNPSQGANIAVSGLETIITSEMNYFSNQAAVDAELYEKMKDQFQQGAITQAKLEIYETNALTSQMQSEAFTKYKIAKGTLETLMGIATMIYEQNQDTTSFYILQAIEVNLAELSKIGAMWEAYQIGDKVGGYWAPYLKWVFMAIAAAVGDMHIMAILSQTPNSKTVPNLKSKMKDTATEELLEEAEKPPVWNPTINWHVYNEQKSETNFSRELYPYVVQAREDMVH